MEAAIFSIGVGVMCAAMYLVVWFRLRAIHSQLKAVADSLYDFRGVTSGTHTEVLLELNSLKWQLLKAKQDVKPAHRPRVADPIDYESSQRVALEELEKESA